MGKDSIVYRHPIFGPTVIDPPVDWTGSQFHNKNWQLNFQKMHWLLAAYSRQTTQRSAQKLFLEYLDFFFDPANKRARLAGVGDHGLADRLETFIVFWEKMSLDKPTKRQLERCIKIHLLRIRDPRVYREKHNHGMMVNRTILRVTKAIPALDPQGKLASDALKALVRQIKDLHDTHGFTREHSIAYQLTNALWLGDALREAATHDGAIMKRAGRSLEIITEAAALLGQMMLRPNGLLAPIGDTKIHFDSKRAQGLLATGKIDDANSAALIAPEAGFVAFRSAYTSGRPPVHVSMMCGWHSHVHKHNDDLSLTLSYGLADILDDPASSPAVTDLPYRSEEHHSTPTIEDHDWQSRQDPNGGTRMIAWGCTEAGVALIAEHRRVVGHVVRRTVVALQSGLLAICDRVSAEARQGQLIQWFQLGKRSRVAFRGASAEISFGSIVRATLHFEGEPEVKNGFLIRNHRRVAAKRLRIRAPSPATVWLKPPSLDIEKVSFTQISEDQITMALDGSLLEIALRPADNAVFSPNLAETLPVALPRLPHLDM